MKKLYKEIAIVLIVFFTIISFIEWRLSNFKAPIDKLFAIHQNNKNASVLVVGNSHTGALIETTDSVFNQQSNNLSLANLELNDRYKVMQYCLPNSNIKKVILGLDVDQIGHNISSVNYDMQMNKYGLKMYHQSTGNNVLAKLNSFRLHLNIKDLIKNIISGVDNDTAKMNFIPFTNKKRNDMEACNKRAQEHSVYQYQQKNIEENLKILINIIALCKKNNASLYFLQTPKPACYSSNYLNAKMLAATATVDSLSQKNNIPFINFMNSPLFDDNDFADFDHLNKSGSNKLIGILQQQLQSGK
jgi:hypothetical protein